MKSKLAKILEGNKILILGFGKEGQSTYKVIRQFIPESHITIADKNEAAFSNRDLGNSPTCKLISGDKYLEGLGKYDTIIKSPGIPMKLVTASVSEKKVISQTELFLRIFSKQVIGISGTKGKSTTSSLIYHILSSYFEDVVLVGNIGVPPFDVIDDIHNETKIVFELSAHQLENISISPHYAVLLNIFQEHLDHFGSYEAYQKAKFNIFRFQKSDDCLFYNADNPVILQKLKNDEALQNIIPLSLNRQYGIGVFAFEDKLLINFSGKAQTLDFKQRKQLPGKHNLLNIMAAVAVCLKMDLPLELIYKSVVDFQGLPHRLEYIGKYKEIYFYNDSIATIPEAVIEAVNTLKNVDTLILGGKDRGIDYSSLINFLLDGKVRNVIFIGKAGDRILKGIKEKNEDSVFNCFTVEQFQEIGNIVLQNTEPGKICLLSPAASSYDLFSSFEERGEAFKEIAENM